MTWTYIMDGKGFSKGKINYPISSDTIFSEGSIKLRAKKIEDFMKNKRSFVSLDTPKSYTMAVASLKHKFGEFRTSMENHVVLRGNLEFVKTNVGHKDFGDDLDLFMMTNPFSKEMPIKVYFEKGKIKEAGMYGEVMARKFIESDCRLLCLGEEFIGHKIAPKIPLPIQDITDFGKVLFKRINVFSNVFSIPIGNSVEINSLQELWMSSVSGESIKGHIQGLNSYNLITSSYSSTRNKARMEYLINYFQPFINNGSNRFNEINFNLYHQNQLKMLVDTSQRDIITGKYLSGYRANVGTIIQQRNKKDREECIRQMLESKNTDLVNWLDDLEISTGLKGALQREKLFSGNFRYYLLALKALPIKYKIADIEGKNPSDLRMATAFAKLIPNILDPKNDEVIVPNYLKDSYLEAVKRFKKENSQIIEDNLKEHHVFR